MLFQRALGANLDRTQTFGRLAVMGHADPCSAAGRTLPGALQTTFDLDQRHFLNQKPPVGNAAFLLIVSEFELF